MGDRDNLEKRLMAEHEIHQTVYHDDRRRKALFKIAAVEIERLKAVNEHDRSQVADTFTAIMEAIRRREWLRLGRGSYEYDDDRWRDEFRQAVDEIIFAVQPLRRIAADWSDCPTDPKEIAVARASSPNQKETSSGG